MKVLFVGPSLSGATPDFTGLVVRAPAKQGDIARAVLDGATAIGLIDGFFDAVAAPWHKEILFALGRGVRMLGASSMGALRAAECAPFGMVPVGAIAEAYCSGALDDDAAVAISHGPEELGYPPLSEPLVNVWPTLDRLRALQLLTEDEHDRLRQRAAELHFKDRSIDALFATESNEALEAAYRGHRVNRKAEDALLLVEALKQCPDGIGPVAADTQHPTFFSQHILPAILDDAG